ncbi:hypothetical protein EVAR_16730_1 [Eumeta japonica]|uniref:Uncharacterized protein n=1 Tax=Eumeta variegata TaxID=151549 RepID=A0A4C1V5Z6_EUMVA|nr:hypothetical protein EVAR_16730_1 [Eumeta japonica]
MYANRVSTAIVGAATRAQRGVRALRARMDILVVRSTVDFKRLFLSTSLSYRNYCNVAVLDTRKRRPEVKSMTGRRSATERRSPNGTGAGAASPRGALRSVATHVAITSRCYRVTRGTCALHGGTDVMFICALLKCATRP